MSGRVALVTRYLEFFSTVTDKDKRAASIVPILSGVLQANEDQGRVLLLEIIRRDPIEQAGLTAWYLSTLRDLSCSQALEQLRTKHPLCSVIIDDLGGVADLSREFRATGWLSESEAILRRVLTASPTNAKADAWVVLIREATTLEQGELAAALSNRAAESLQELSSQTAIELLDVLFELHMTPQLNLLSGRLVKNVDGRDARLLSSLLDRLIKYQLNQPLSELIARGIANVIKLDDRDVQRYVATALLRGLKTANASAEVASLARRLADETDLSRPGTTSDIAAAMSEVGTRSELRRLAARATSTGYFSLACTIDPELGARYPFGREVDGTPSSLWTWQDLNSDWI